MMTRPHVLTVRNLLGVLLVVGLAAVCATAVLALEPWVAPDDAAAKANPVAGKAEATEKGKTVFTTNCVPCHGELGKGDGAAGQYLDPKPKDLSAEATQSQKDGALFWKITNGRGVMPAFGAMIPEEDRWAAINYIRQLAKK
ncbi:MAG: cytochrome c [Candidatus Schekmanbacteria bacterium]|nr:cytochrome c [Candidatus Schekmanbacteria bacterium]